MIRVISRSDARGIKIIATATFTLILALLLHTAGAQSSYSDLYENNSLRTSLGIILIISSAIIFVITVFIIYIRQCCNSHLLTTSTSFSTPISTTAHTNSIPSSHGGSRGLHPSILSTFPSFTYSEVKSHKIGKGALECAVCLDEFTDEEIIKLLPKCDHVFHLDCIDAWLRSHITCPVCRANLDPDPDQASSATGPSRTGSEAVSLLRWTSDETIRGSSSDLPRTVSEGERIERRRSSNSIWRTPSLSVIGSFFFSKFGRSNSTGHCVVQPGDDLNRFTLKLPREIRNQILNRSASALVLPTVSSMRNGYRTSGRGRRQGLAEMDERWSWSWLRIGSSLFNRSWNRPSPDVVGSIKYNSTRPVV